MNILTNLNLSQNQIQNALMHPLGTPPTGVESQVYYNLNDHLLYVHNGTAWTAVGASYTLPIASDTVLGGIKVGTGLSIDGSGILSANLRSVKVNGTELTITNNAVDILIVSGVANGQIKVNNIDVDVYTHPTTDGYLHVPETSTTNNAKFLKAGATAGSLSWSFVTKTDVGLANVTDDAQIKKSASSTNGYIPIWSGTTGDTLGAGYSVETTLSGASTAIPRADAVKTYIDGILAASDAMIYKGTLGIDGTITALPTTHSAGWAYKVITAGTYAGITCEVGDLIIAVMDRTGSGNLNSDWTAVQSNLDGAVIGPASSTDGYFPIFNGTTGKLIANSTYSPSSFSLSGHTHGTYDRVTSVLSGGNVFSDIVIVDGIVTGTSTRTLTATDIGATKKYTTTLGNGTDTSFIVTHNLNSRDVVITIRETGDDYEVVYTDVKATSANTVTVLFATAPSAAQYTITVVG